MRLTDPPVRKEHLGPGSIAEKLGYLYVDTGAIYRTLGYHIYAKGLNPKDGAAVSAELPGLRVEMSHGGMGCSACF